MKKPKMGQVVLVKVLLKRETVRRRRGPGKDSGWETNRLWKRLAVEYPVGRPGWVTGYRHVQEGTVEEIAEYSIGYEPPDPEGSYLEPTNIIPVLLVVFWPNMNPVKVPLDAWEETELEPWAVSEQDRERMRREYVEFGCKDNPRDEKGRWI
jgi:hypothetical protein